MWRALPNRRPRFGRLACDQASTRIAGRIAGAPLGLCSPTTQVHSMLYTIAVVLLILWLLGVVTSYTVGGVIHVLLIVALIMIVYNLISGRRAL
jgi:uncharacterized protein DUF5670